MTDGAVAREFSDMPPRSELGFAVRWDGCYAARAQPLPVRWPIATRPTTDASSME
jgi:hypothetical protein